MKPQPHQTFQISANGKSQRKNSTHGIYRPSALLVEATAAAAAAAASVCTSTTATLSLICRFVNSQLNTDTYTKNNNHLFDEWWISRDEKTATTMTSCKNVKYTNGLWTLHLVPVRAFANVLLWSKFSPFPQDKHKTFQSLQFHFHHSNYKFSIVHNKWIGAMFAVHNASLLSHNIMKF